MLFNGQLLDGVLEVQGQPLVRNGIMVGAAGEPVLNEIIDNM